MKIQEIVNEELYKALLELEPKYYYGKIGTLEQTKEYAKELFRRINCLLEPFNPKITVSIYHKSRTKKKIELCGKTIIQMKGGKTRKREDIIEVLPDGKTSQTSILEQSNNNMEDW